MKQPSIQMKGVVFSYPDGTPALNEVDLAIESGEKVALLGPNGSGKSTLVLQLNGILEPQQGQLRVGGLEVTGKNLTEIRRRVGVVFQDPDDQLFMPTVREDIEFGPRNLGWEEEDIAERAERVMSELGILRWSDRSPAHLSAGQKRRVAIAGVMVMSPDVLVLDEPTAYLDPASRADLCRLLGQLEVTQLTATHDLLFVWEFCSRCLIIDQGTIVADGPTAEILSDRSLLRQHRLELPVGVEFISPISGA